MKSTIYKINWLIIIVFFANTLLIGQIASEFDYIRNINISPSTSIEDLPVKIEFNGTMFDYTNAMTNGEDIRFYDESGNLLYHYIERWNLSDSSIVWVKVKSIGTSMVRMVYGNSSATNLSNGDSVFTFFDDFEDGTVWSDKWLQSRDGSSFGYSTVTQANGKLAMTETCQDLTYCPEGPGLLISHDNFIFDNEPIVIDVTFSIASSSAGRSDITINIVQDMMYSDPRGAWDRHYGVGGNAFSTDASFVFYPPESVNIISHLFFYNFDTPYKHFVKYDGSTGATLTIYDSLGIIMGSRDDVISYSDSSLLRVMLKIEAPGSFYDVIKIYKSSNDVISTIIGSEMQINMLPIVDSFDVDDGSWTEFDTGSKIELDYSIDQRLEFDNWIRWEEGFVGQAITPITNFMFDYDFNITADWGNANQVGPAFSDSYGTLSDIQDGNGIYLVYYAGTGSKMYLYTVENGTVTNNYVTGGNSISITVGETYYASFKKEGNELTYNLYSDQSRTTHISGSPVSVTTAGFDDITFDNFYAVNGWAASDTANNPEWTSGWIDNINLREVIQPSPLPIVDSFDVDDGSWTEFDTGSKIELDYSIDQRLEFDNWIRWEEGFVGQAITPITNFMFDYDFNITADWGNANQVGPAFSDSYGTLSDIQDGNGIYLVYYAGTGSKMYLYTVENGTVTNNYVTGGNSISITVGETYYASFKKEGNELTYNLYSDQSRTTHISGSPVSVTTAGFDDITFDNFYAVNGWAASDTANNPEWTSGWIDNINLSEIDISVVYGLDADLPINFNIYQNFPNPFNPTTLIRYALPKSSNVALVIYNIMGQEIMRWDENDIPAGYYQKTWNGTNKFGVPVGSGVYLYRLVAGDFVETRKMVLLK